VILSEAKDLCILAAPLDHFARILQCSANLVRYLTEHETSSELPSVKSKPQRLGAGLLWLRFGTSRTRALPGGLCKHSYKAERKATGKEPECGKIFAGPTYVSRALKRLLVSGHLRGARSAALPRESSFHLFSSLPESEAQPKIPKPEA